MGKEHVEKDFANNMKALEERNKYKSTKTSEAESVVARPGSGYLSEGSAISLGLIDGDEEIKVLKKVRRLETRLEAERNKVKALGKELTDLQAAKESVEKDFANTKNELEEKSNKLLEKINALESKLEETESRAIAAEEELNPVKKELLKTQIAETKAQQELYKLKIEKLKNDEE
jgi:chromosome segregation ATPase